MKAEGSLIRSAYTQMISDVEAEKSALSLMKDMTRWGRDYLQVGNAMEIFRRNNVRFIAINNGIDSIDQKHIGICPLYQHHVRVVCKRHQQESKKQELKPKEQTESLSQQKLHTAI